MPFCDVFLPSSQGGSTAPHSICHQDWGLQRQQKVGSTPLHCLCWLDWGFQRWQQVLWHHIISAPWSLFSHHHKYRLSSCDIWLPASPPCWVSTPSKPCPTRLWPSATVRSYSPTNQWCSFAWIRTKFNRVQHIR